MSDNVTKLREGQSDSPVICPEDKFKETLASYNTMKSDMDSARGEMGSLLKNAEDQHQLHRKAFKDVQKLEKMDAAKRADYLRAFNAYLKYLGLDAQPDMFDEAAKEAEAEEPAAAEA